MRLEVLNPDLAHLPDSPDVTHHAAAIAAVVRKQDQNRNAAGCGRARTESERVLKLVMMFTELS
jgi:hypothetical protein